MESKSKIENEDDLNWDAAAEAELIAIENSYLSSKRRRRQLPNWSRTNFAPSPCKLRYPAIKFTGRVVYCRTAREVESATKEIVERMREEGGERVPLGFDIEWKPNFRRGEVPRKAAVMQICVDAANCYVMHIIHSGIPYLLKSLLGDSSSVKVGVCIANDALKIARDYDVSVEPLEDLSEYANLKLGGAPKRWSLASLTETLTCKELPKPGKIRMGNWEANVLSKEQLQYAATDAFVSWYLYKILMTFPDESSTSELTVENNTQSVI